jgi:hypothetical protein
VKHDEHGERDNAREGVEPLENEFRVGRGFHSHLEHTGFSGRVFMSSAFRVGQAEEKRRNGLYGLLGLERSGVLNTI